MEKVKVIFRKCKNPYTNEWEIVAFFPECIATYGHVMSYMHVGQHGEASLEFYRTTKKATPEEYADLLEELKGVYHDCELIIRQRINHTDLRGAWYRS